MTTRRDFLKMLGIGGVTAAVAPSMFTSRVEAAPVRLLASEAHFVYEVQRGPLLVPDATAYYLSVTNDVHSKHDPISAIGFRNPKHRRDQGWNQKTGGIPWSPFGEALTYQTKPQPAKDPIIGYYMAAAELQRTIHEDTRRFAEGLARYSLVMVTVVDAPIIAFPLPDKGFYLETSLTQFAARPSAIVNQDRSISNRGEIPIDEPNAITMRYMMLIQEELREMGMLRPDPKRETVAEARRRLGNRGLILT
jgi:hypothetical protein